MLVVCGISDADWLLENWAAMFPGALPPVQPDASSRTGTYRDRVKAYLHDLPASVAEVSAEQVAAHLGPKAWRDISGQIRGQLIASGVADLHGDQPTDRDRNNIQRATGLDVKGNVIPGAGGAPGTNQHDMLTGSDPDGRAFIDGVDHTCNNWTSDQMTLPQQNANVPADRARAMLGHVDRTGGNNTSWNAAHMSQGCAKQALINTGGAGRFYCFATN
jgi:hypothetical protein